MRKRVSLAFGALGGLSVAVAAAAPSSPKTLDDCMAQKPDTAIRTCADHLKMVCVVDAQKSGGVRGVPADTALTKCMTAAEDTDAISKCSNQATAQQRAAQGETRQATKACRDAIESRVSGFFTAEETCNVGGALSACLALPDEKDGNRCLSRCIEARDAAMNQSADTERDACIARYVEADGKGHSACSLPGATTEDVKILEAEIKPAMAAAFKARDGAALDAVKVRSDAQFLGVLQAACTKTCNERGPNVLAAQKKGPSFVTSYKRCMVAADSTLEARKLAVYETDLYCDYLRKADERCRAANKCDLVEANSDLQCTYVLMPTI